jgi:hypothetical protein
MWRHTCGPDVPRQNAEKKRSQMKLEISQNPMAKKIKIIRAQQATANDETFEAMGSDCALNYMLIR